MLFDFLPTGFSSMYDLLLPHSMNGLIIMFLLQEQSGFSHNHRSCVGGGGALLLPLGWAPGVGDGGATRN